MISMDKKYKTRDGQGVRLISVSGNELRPIVGYIGDNVMPDVWNSNGENPYYESLTLIEVKEKKTIKVWVNIYPMSQIQGYKSKERADDYAYDGRIACVPVEITYEEGEGL